MAAAGDPAAQVMLGSAYYAGFGVPMDSSEAVKWIRAAADQGHVRGQFALAELYLAGDGVSRDVPLAIKWFRLAAGQGDASAQLRLEMLTETGLVPGRDARGESGDDSRTLERYRLAAAGQSPLAQMRLGEIYLRGDIVPQAERVVLCDVTVGRVLQGGRADHRVAGDRKARCVDLDADHVVPLLREAHPGDQAHIAGADDRDPAHASTASRW